MIFIALQGCFELLNSTIVFATLQIQASHILVGLVALRGKFESSEIVAFGGIEVFLIERHVAHDAESLTVAAVEL